VRGLSDLLRAGDHTVEPAEAWRVRAVNAISLLCAGICAPMAVGLAVTGRWPYALAALFGVLLHALTPELLSRRGRHLAARATLTLLAPLAVSAFAAGLGPASGIATFLYVIPGFSVVAFGRRRLLLAVGIILPLTLRWLVSVAWDHGSYRWASPEVIEISSTATVLSTIAGALAVAWILRTETANERARAAAARADALASARRLEAQTVALEDAQQRSTDAAHRLAVASHRAGMARAASEVLHDAGNALNGVGVAAVECEQALASVRIDGLVRAADLCRRLEPGDPRTAQLANYLEGIETERRAAVARVDGELETLTKRCAHIVALVHRQLEPVLRFDSRRSADVAELVEHAVQVGVPARSGIEAELRLPRELAMQTDVDALLAILLNLIGNAADALSEVGRTRALVEVRDDAEAVTFVVEDDGPGVPAERRAQIFAGLTTKAHGHGYGLASSAKAADRMGGTLRCVDPVELSGARFELTLPRAA